MKELAKRETAEIVTYPDSQDSMLERMMMMAVEKGVDPETMSKMLDMQERIMDKKAEQEFNQAIMGFQSDCKPVKKNKSGVHGSTFASLDHIAKAIAPILEKHKLTYSFESNVTDGRMNVTCVVKHVSGHSSKSEFSAPFDDAAKMNEMQKYASALSYARRYALQLALGLTTTDEDDDGCMGGTVYISDEQLADLESLMTEVGADKAGFLKYCKLEKFEDMPATKYKTAINALEAKRKAQ